MLDGRALLSFAVLPGNKAFAMPPEFIDPRFVLIQSPSLPSPSDIWTLRYDDDPVKTNVANWVNSGMHLTSPQAFLDFYYRGFCQMAHHFGRQVGQEATMQVDYAKLAECFTLVEKNGTVHHPKVWTLHPGSTVACPELGCTRKQSIKLWEDHKAKHAKLIPYAVHMARQRARGKCYILFTYIMTLSSATRETLVQGGQTGQKRKCKGREDTDTLERMCANFSILRDAYSC